MVKAKYSVILSYKYSSAVGRSLSERLQWPYFYLKKKIVARVEVKV